MPEYDNNKRVRQMSVKETKSEGLSHEYEVTVPANDIDKAIDAELQRVGKSLRVPGFRPGKVPMKVMRQKYGKAVMGEVLEKVVNDNTQKILKDKKITPAMQPKIEVKSFADGEDLVYTMAVEAMPEIELKSFKNLKLEKPVAEVDDKAVKTTLERLAAQSKSSKPIEGKRAAKKGDIVNIDFNGRTADDNVEQPGMQAKGHNLELGSGQFIPGFEDQLIGKKAGEKVEVKVSFPKEYGAKDLAGRDAIFDVEIHEIREVTKAEPNDEMAKNFGFETLDGLKDAVRQQLQGEYENASKMKMKRALLDQLDEDYDFVLPQGMVDMEYEQISRQIESENAQQGKAEKLSATEQKELKEIAQRRVRLGLILSRVGQENKIQVQDQELQQAVIREAQKYPGQEQQVYEFYSKNRQALESLRAPLFEEKVVDYLVELAEVKEKKVSADELMRDEDDDHVHDEHCGHDHGEEKPKAKKAASSTAKKKADDKPAAKKTATAKKPAAKKKA